MHATPKHRIDQFAVDVPLKLPAGGVANPHRFRILKASQPIERQLRDCLGIAIMGDDLLGEETAPDGAVV